MTKRYWWVVISYVIMQFSVILGAPLFYFLFKLTEAEAIIYFTIFSFLAGLVVFLLLMKPDMKEGVSPDASATGTTVGWIIGGVFMALAAQALAANIEIHVFGIKTESENTKNIMDISKAFPIFYVIPVLIAPILEEILFRKIIFGALYNRTNFWIAALISSVIFAVIHQDPKHILVYASMGLTFAFLYVKTKRIIVPILVHMGMNTTAVLGQLLLTPEKMEKLEQQMNFIQQQIIGG
ncbi:CPBP family intramembrane glutamic endopeptidase [Virgibacillus halophilus]|uniref:Type II CAAX endopeptidase family protein n=1 Tax=Tigheibacillus halophilus TaxID=361280 RepID=A0ABU5C8X0_9BACI|nr:type II CAAX endopeptidase family protein [Virgibacillus halophilus]